MSKKTELVDKLEAFLIENKSIKTEVFREIYPFLNDIRKQLTLTDVGCSLPSKEEIKQEANKYSDIDGIICADEKWVIDRNESFIDGAEFVVNYKKR